MHSLPLPDRLRSHVEALTREGPRHPSNPEAVATTLAYLTQTLEAMGYRVGQVRYGPDPQNVNLLVEVPAIDARAPLLEVGAHWDSVAGSPGADDNASGVAGLLEVARALSGTTLRRRVRLCFFGDEEDSEQFRHSGSQKHVERLDETGEDVEGVIVLEMIGYRDHNPGSQQFPPRLDLQELPHNAPGNFIAAIGDGAAGDYVQALVEAARAGEPPLELVPLLVDPHQAGDLARSDHSRYWAAGRLGVMLTDTANFRNPHYHAATDTTETLDLDFAAQVTSAVVRAVRTLAL